MLNLTTCEIRNETDGNYYRLYVEWFADLHFKLLLLRPTMPPLCGEMTTKDVQYYSDELVKSSDEYLAQTKKAFSDEDTDIQFFINDNVFKWVRKMWTLGKIVMHPISEIEGISEVLRRLLERHEIVQGKLEILERENRDLYDTKTKLRDNVEEMIRIKTNMERDLYKRFLLILNAKKKKIRQLQQGVEKNERRDNLAYEASTDQSEESDDDTSKSKDICGQNTKLQKHKLNTSNEQKDAVKIRKLHTDTGPEANSNVILHPKASTSKDYFIESGNSPMSSVSSTETECDLQLKVIDELIEVNPSTSCLDYVEEELEEDMFS